MSDQPIHRRPSWRPLTSLLLALAWLMLQQSLSVANLLVAALIGWLLPLGLSVHLDRAARPRAPIVALRLAWTVFRDIVVSNVTVARLVLTPGRVPSPAWVPVPMAVNDPLARALLASIITMTPGTVSCIVDEDRRVIWVHALDCVDPQALVADIQQRYEQPLLEILG